MRLSPVATVTLARTDEEAERLIGALRQLAERQRAVVVCDGGSPTAFVERIRQLPGVVLAAAEGRGLLAQVKASLRAAAAFGASSIVYTEADKREFFEDGFDAFLGQAAEAAADGVTLAARSAASYRTFPDFQQYTESVINRLCADATNVSGDYSYGPFVMHRSVAEKVLTISEDVGWGWRPFAFATAGRLGQAVTLLEGDYPCPPAQRRDEERLHRIDQLQQNIRGLLLAMRERDAISAADAATSAPASRRSP